jgi:serine/threonine protein kinase/tetratricopeptide (TPR) repeat protein
MIGSRLGPYEIREEIGRGGMAAVYRAYQTSVDREVAIKVILKSIALDDHTVQRFQREARLIARLEHPHILPIYDFDGGHEPPYIVMRFLDGGTLKEVMRQGHLPLDEIAYLIRQVGTALDYAHRQGIIHRDVKPSNIMIDRDGNAFVTDFGIARMVGAGGSHLTDSNAIIGTPDYMSPEQAKGDSNIDSRADIYSLGIVLFETLTDQLPFISDIPMDVIMKQIDEPAPRVCDRNPSLPLELNGVLARALAKDRDKRYSSLNEFMEAVIGALQSTSSNPSRLREAAEKSWVRRRVKGAPDQTDSQATPSEQHKVVTALYANAAEYAEIVDERHGAEAARKMLDALLSEFERIIVEKNGKIFERTDRELLAVWGGQVGREDDAENAVRAALGMADILRKFGTLILTEEEPLPLKIGIHSGLALLTPGKTGTASASGMTISLANRLMQQSDGEILITHDTYKNVRGVFDVQESVPLKLRTSRELLATYYVEQAKPRSLRMNSRGVEGIETRMIGRESELKALQNALLDTIEDNETHAVTIVAEAGLGKSRLLYELNNYLELRPETFRVLRGQCSPEMTGRPYALVRDILSFRYEILDNDPPATVRKKLEEGIREMIGEDQELAHLLGHLAGFDFADSPYIRGLLGDSQQLINRARLLFIRWLIKLSERNPLVIYIEDLHRADNASLDLLSTLVSENDSLSLLIVCTARPGLFETRPSWGSGQRNHLRLDLRPLDKRDSRSLGQEILQRVSEIPRSLRDLLVERAEGNPYYMEELTKMLMDNRLIVRETPEVWRVEESRIGHLELPTTLVGLLQARLDGLLYPERLTLQRAAVIGNVFYNTALLAIDSADETHVGDLEAVLRHLAEREFIHLRESSAFEGSLEYTFNSNMLREMLVATLVSRQVTAYYAAVARWLISISGKRVNEYNALIAQYYEKAGDLVHAAAYLHRAGEHSLNISAYSEARATFEHTLHLLPADNIESTSLTVQMGIACYYLADYPLARQHLNAALESARSHSYHQQAAHALYWLSQISNETDGNYEDARRYLEEALELARAHQPESSLEARILYGLGDVHWRLGNFEQERAYCEQSVELAQRLGDLNTELYALNRLGTLAYLENADEAGSFFQQVYDKAMMHGDRERAAHALNNLGNVFMKKGDLAGAKSFIEKALALVQEIGLQQHSSAGWMLDSLIDISLKLGDTDTARRYAVKNLIFARQIGLLPLLLYTLMQSARIILTGSELDEYGLALLGLVSNHPASDFDTRQALSGALAALGLDSNDPRVLTGMEKGTALDVDLTVNSLLTKFGES